MNNTIPQFHKNLAFPTMIWWQDGVPSHYGQLVPDYLDNSFVR